MWDPIDRALTCSACWAESPGDPFVGVDSRLTGEAGGSAQAEFERRSSRGAAGAARWHKGAEGERILSQYLLKDAAKERFMLLDDRRIPGSRANIDHIAIARSGVFVIDTKNYAGRVEKKTEGFLNRSETLLVGGRDRTSLAAAAYVQADLVREVLAVIDSNAVPVIPVLCFVGEDSWGLIDRPLVIGDTSVLWPRALRRQLRAEGPVGGADRTRTARFLSVEFSPATATG